MSKQIRSLVRYIIESLGLRRLGDAHWTEQVENMKQELTTTILLDRVLIEQSNNSWPITTSGINKT